MGALQDMPTVKIPPEVPFLLESSLSPSQFWMLKTTAALQRLSLAPTTYFFYDGIDMRRRTSRAVEHQMSRSSSIEALGFLPSNISVAHKDGSHRKGRGKGRAKLGAFGLGRRLLIWDNWPPEH